MIARMSAAMYLIAANTALLAHVVAHGIPLWPVFIAGGLGVISLVVGPRLRHTQLYAFAVFGAASIAAWYSLSDGYGDAAVLYIWPTLFTALFFDGRRAALIVAWTAIVHAIALATVPDAPARVTQWVDVVVTVALVSLVVSKLAVRNERLVARLRAEARVDPLTGLLNRRGLHERLEIELRRAQREHSWLAVVVLDLDHFKAINDQYGHDFGDRVLTWLGGVLRHHARKVDIVARTGGEEFIVVLPGQDPVSAQAFAQRVREAVATSEHGDRLDAPHSLHRVACTISCGVASTIAPTDHMRLLHAADRAMYAAKHAGRNAVFVADAFDERRLPLAA